MDVVVSQAIGGGLAFESRFGRFRSLESDARFLKQRGFLRKQI
jgi:hypothetical protein